MNPSLAFSKSSSLMFAVTSKPELPGLVGDLRSEHADPRTASCLCAPSCLPTVSGDPLPVRKFEDSLAWCSGFCAVLSLASLAEHD
jgi:hypothetical protein